MSSIRICKSKDVGYKVYTTGILHGHPFDLCKCGDYRKEHKDGIGSCNLNGLGHCGAPECRKFKIDKRYTEGTNGAD